jgi:thioredoxin reductase (NADPH)
MIARRDRMRASKVMQDRVMKTDNIVIHWNTSTREVLGQNKVEAVRVINHEADIISDIPVSAFFVAIGHQPNSSIFKDGLIWMKLAI